jgi:hypothetical protein
VTGSRHCCTRRPIRQQIIIMAHLDTYAPMSDADIDNNLGG